MGSDCAVDGSQRGLDCWYQLDPLSSSIIGTPIVSQRRNQAGSEDQVGLVEIARYFELTLLVRPFLLFLGTLEALQVTYAKEVVEEIFPSHNRLQVGREEVVFVEVQFADEQGQVVSPSLDRRKLTETARHLVDFGGGGVLDGKEIRHGLFGYKPFYNQEGKFNFWFLQEPLVVHPGEDYSCHAKIPRFSQVHRQIVESLRERGLDHLQVVYLLPTSCLDMGSTLDLEPLLGFLRNPELSFVCFVEEAIDAGDVEEVIRQYLRRAASPWILFSLGISSDEPDSGNPEIPLYMGKGFVHEWGHSFGGFADLYTQSGFERLQALLVQMNREYAVGKLCPWVGLALVTMVDTDVLSLLMDLGLPDVFQNLCQTFNPLKLIVRHPVVTEILGHPLGYPHCAMDEAEARFWWYPFKGQGEGDLKVTFDELGWNRGCFYLEGTFFRSSENSLMRAGDQFDPVEVHALQQKLVQIGERINHK